MKGDTRTFSIYAMCDPRDGKIRYIGSTTLVNGRISTHLWEARRAYTNRKCAWLRELMAADLEPEVFILSTAIGKQAARLAELEAMRKHSEHLLNGSYPVSAKQTGKPHGFSLKRGSNVSSASVAKFFGYAPAALQVIS